jgi:hypothetical protein
MRSTNEKILRLFLPVAIGATCMFALASAVKAVGNMTGASPRVGDIVSYTALGDHSDAAGTPLTARRHGRPDCTLDPGTLQTSGGSFVIENELAGAPGSFVVHWAGSRTTNGSDDCGADADLLMAARDLDALAVAAGGYGAGKKWLPMFVEQSDK